MLFTKHHLAYFPGAKAIYSDVNMLLLQKIIEVVAKNSIDGFLQENFFSKMAMSSTFFNPHAKYYERIVPTEYSILR